MMAATIKDVAKLANVSPSTVSRVIAGSNRISSQTKHRVHQAMEALHYVPNANARSLARANTRTVGFTMARQADEAFSNPFFPELMRGMSATAQQKGYNILLSISSTPDEEAEKCLQLYREKRVDGLVVSTSRVNDPLIKRLDQEGIPFVLVGKCVDQPVLSVNNDNVQAAKIATSHLLEEGYKRVVYMGGDPSLVVSLDRLNGYKQALIERDMRIDPELMIDAEFAVEDGYRALCELHNKGVSFDAVMATDDLLALGAVEFAKSRGYRVPEDFGIVGFNDSPMMSYVDPPLTSVKILAYELGMEAMELLLTALDQPEKVQTRREIIFPSELIIRTSSCRRR